VSIATGLHAPKMRRAAAVGCAEARHDDLSAEPLVDRLRPVALSPLAAHLPGGGLDAGDPAQVVNVPMHGLRRAQVPAHARRQPARAARTTDV
jgi:hypothetical protein